MIIGHGSFDKKCLYLAICLALYERKGIDRRDNCMDIGMDYLYGWAKKFLMITNIDRLLKLEKTDAFATTGLLWSGLFRSSKLGTK